MSKKIVLDKWQEEVLAHKGDLLLCTGRRVGKTYIMAVKAAERLVAKPNTQIIVVSLTEDQAKLIIHMCVTYLEQHHKTKIAKGRHKPTLSTITLINKSKIQARPVGNTGDAVRGFTGNVLIVDEASRMPKLMWMAAKPILLTTGGEIWMCSTPHGKQGYFWEKFDEAHNKKDPKARFKVYYMSSEEVIMNRPISSSWTNQEREAALKVLDEEKRDMSTLEYGQEYLGLFMEDLMRYFEDDLIIQCCTEKRPETIPKKHPLYMGVDIARMGEDESTFEIVKKISKTNIIHIENLTTTKTLTTETESNILSLDKKYNLQKIFIDAGAGSLGVGIYDHLLEQDQTNRKIVAINNRARVLDKHGTQKQRLLKEDLYDNLRNLMQRKHIKLLDDENLITSLRSIQYEIVTKPSGQSHLRIFGDYTHIVEGLIRAVWCSKEKDINIWVKSIRV